jgi:hypothetical protein
MSELMSFVETHKCPFPLPSDVPSTSTFYQKVDHVCGSDNFVTEDLLMSTKGDAGKQGLSIKPPTAETFMCVGVADLVSRICTEASSSSPEIVKKIDNLSILPDLKSEADDKATAVSGFCDSLRNIGPNDNDLHPKIASFYTEFLKAQSGGGAADQSKKSCEAFCTNTEVAGVMEGSDEPLVNPVCSLFKKAYGVLKEFKDANKQGTALTGVNNAREGVSDYQKSNKEEAADKTALVKNGLSSQQLEKTVGENTALNSLRSPANPLSSSSVRSSNLGVHNISPLPPQAEEVQGDDPNAHQPDQGNKDDVKLSGSNNKSPADVVKNEDVKKDEPVPPAAPAATIPASAGKDTPNKIPISSSSSTVSSVDASKFNDADGDIPSPLGSKVSGGDGILSGGAPQEPSPSPSSAKKEAQNADKDDKAVSVAGAVSSSSPKSVAGTGGEEEGKLPNPLGDDYAGNTSLEDLDDAANNGNNNNDNKDDPLGMNSRNEDDSYKKKTSAFKKKEEQTIIYSDSKPDSNSGLPGSFDVDNDVNGGYFNYFLFFLTFMALCFFAFHNKRRVRL